MSTQIKVCFDEINIVLNIFFYSALYQKIYCGHQLELPL